MREEKKIIAELIEKALEGKLSLDELYNSWPSELDGIEFYERAFDQIESAVEHFPGKLISGERDYEKWTTSQEYFELKNTLNDVKYSS